MNRAEKILKQIMVKLGMEVKLEQMKLTDGVTIIEADSWDAGAEVFIVTEDDQRIPVPVGEFELEDGRMLIVVEEGVIAEVKAMEEAVEEEAGEMEATPAPATAPNNEQTPKSIIEVTSKEYKFSNEELTNKVAELEAKIIELTKVEEVVELEETPKPIVHNPENKTEKIKIGLKADNDPIARILNNIYK